MAESLFPLHVGPDRQVVGGEREVLDAYWTPQAAADACYAVLLREPGAPRCERPVVLEPAVGGGSWVRAAQHHGATTLAMDIDATAPGLLAADYHKVGDFFDLRQTDFDERPDIVVGNPPYSGDLAGWIEHSFTFAPVVAYLLRSTFLGSIERSTWWARHPPSSVHVLAPRPRWGGPGARAETDTVDSIFVIWVRGEHDTRLRWIRW